MSEKLFTQEEVNEIVQNRLKGEKEKFKRILQDRIQEATAETNEELNNLREHNRKAALHEALKQEDAASITEIAKLLDGNVVLDEDFNAVFKYEDGTTEPVLNGVRKYMDSNPWARGPASKNKRQYVPNGGIGPQVKNEEDERNEYLRRAIGLKVDN